MFRCYTEITFKAKGDLDRNIQFTMDFVREFEANDTWADLTNKCKIIFPKSIYVLDEEGNRFPLGGTTDNKTIDYLFRCGDSVSLNFGYYINDNGDEYLEKPTTPVFSGFISKVASRKPITIECEDNMWLLKQIQCKPRVWPAGQPVENLLRELLQGTGLTVNALTTTGTGAIVIGNESVAQLLKRLRDEFHLESYFRGTELRIGSLVYIPSDNVDANGQQRQAAIFKFQQNIISDELEFKRKDDIKLSAVCESLNTVAGEANKKGNTKTSRDRLTILIYGDSTTSTGFNYKIKEKDQDFPLNEDGERRTLNYSGISDADILFDLGVNEIKKYYYTGFFGKFTTFGVPYVRSGDEVQLVDPLLPDRDGTYKVRAVEYKGGTGGHRQIITLDYKLF